MELMIKPFYFILVLGCQMNKNDAERMETILQNAGWSRTENKEEADAIFIVTCSVRQTAEDRVYGLAHNFAKLRRKNPNLLIGITGCMAGRDTDGKIRQRLSFVNFFFPIHEMTKLPEWLKEKKQTVSEVKEDSGAYLKTPPKISENFRAFVSIQTGCNKFCSYCVVPYARGREKCRPVKDTMEEIRRLVDNGCLEVTLLGQAVNNYIAPDPENFSKDNPYKDHFAALIWEINQTDLKRLHYTAPYPNHMTDEVIDALALPVQVNYLHLPVQSGDNEVLRRMNRRHTREQYLEIVKKIKARVPDIALGTDIIVGFCGETEEQFERTLDLYRQCDFDISYHARYSQRSGTLAAKIFKDDVSKEEKKRRWRKIQNLMEETTLRKNQKFQDQIVEVLVDRSEAGVCWGTTNEMKTASFPGGPELVGKLVKMMVEKADVWVLFGKLN
ncbi:TPA: tRNA (N6-isopentenyl adenosine(37)-C2)-methylthiotransferase MiaB [Candidatus Uhrbacteria bacterium]|nr:tRNA (N6-isopentenyl adenosine(37)-C2)-methylthiotransferase MiaB [Candidatus Uhrbacteria bacterium]HCU31931.1 tRNA (N6-isopentenyl adenosine(37)-C2)-methylthiotransferase MiaB [Candidatus Uhrbacteria bacterium]